MGLFGGGWVQRSHVCGYRDDVVIAHLVYGFLHQRRIAAVSRAVLELMQLSGDVYRMESGDSRNVAQPLERIAVAYSTGDGLAVATVLRERFTFLNGTGRHISDESGVRIPLGRSSLILWQCNDPAADRLHPAARLRKTHAALAD